MKSKFGVDSKKVDWLFGNPLKLFLIERYFLFVSIVDAFNYKFSEFNLFKEAAHDEIVDVVIFDQLSWLLGGDNFESVDLSDNSYHELSEHLYFCDHVVEL